MIAPDTLGLVHSTVGDLRFDECVDEGGFGTVYRGRHLATNELVAIKCLRLSRLASLTERMRASIVARFQEEMTILQELSQGTHDIVRCFSSGQVFAPATGERVPYIVLEWLDGRPLSADLAERRERSAGGRTLRETLDLVESAALAIAHAHTRGIIHRDIKPSNLMLAKTRGGGIRLKVLDFGLAKILSGGPGSATNIATADGVRLVSVAYCAPEQLSSSVGEVGPWTDIYSLTLVMLEVMRGEKIPHPTTASLRASRLGITLPPPIEDLLARAVSQNPLERPANASIFWAALRELTRQSSHPVADASALAATAFDGTTAAVLSNVRAPSASGESRSAVANHVNPFTGTMVMVNGPGGALHLLGSHAAGAHGQHSAPQITTMNDPASSPTEPFAPRIGAQGGGPAALPAALPHGGTMGLAPPRSPLASSLGANVRSPLARQPDVAPMPASDPPPLAAPPRFPVAIGFLIFVVLAALGMAGYLWTHNR